MFYFWNEPTDGILSWFIVVQMLISKGVPFRILHYNITEVTSVVIVVMLVVDANLWYCVEIYVVVNTKTSVLCQHTIIFAVPIYLHVKGKFLRFSSVSLQKFAFCLLTYFLTFRRWPFFKFFWKLLSSFVLVLTTYYLLTIFLNLRAALLKYISRTYICHNFNVGTFLQDFFFVVVLSEYGCGPTCLVKRGLLQTNSYVFRQLSHLQ